MISAGADMLAWVHRLEGVLGHAVFIDASLQDPTLYWPVASALKLPAVKPAEVVLHKAFRKSGGWRATKSWSGGFMQMRDLVAGSPVMHAYSEDGDQRTSTAMAMYGEQVVCAFGDGLFSVLGPDRPPQFAFLGR